MRSICGLCIISFFAFLCVTSYSVLGRADEITQEIPPEIPVPHFVRYKKPLPELLLKQKKEGRYLTGFPAIGWDPDTKFNVGAMLQFYDNGDKESPFFSITPYRQMIQVAGVITTGSVVQAQAYYDQPYILDTPWRVRGVFDFYRNPYKNYFGIGEAGQQLTFPGTGQVFGSYDDYKNALEQQIGGETYERYDNYKYTHTVFTGTAEYDLLGGYIRPLFGFQVAYVWIGDYTGDTVSGALELPTHLRDDCNAGITKGCNGGWDNFVKLGIAFDTRDFEPNPNKGIFWELTAELSPKFLGSSFNYGRLTTDLRAFGQILDYKKQNLVIAGRFYYGWQFGDVPFYSMNTLAFTDKDKTGLGGFDSIRGYRLDRFIGPVQIMTNLELRWSFYDFTIWKQNIRLGIKPFFDAGRVFDKVSDTSLKNWKIGAGGGLNLAWNLSTVINFDMAWSPEGNAFYMQVGHQF